jgi:hypothetical protein
LGARRDDQAVVVVFDDLWVVEMRVTAVLVRVTKATRSIRIEDATACAVIGLPE